MLLSRRAKIALAVVGILIVLLIAFVKLSGTYVDYLWFGEVGARGVFSTVLWTRVVLFLVFGALMALVIGGNVLLAYRMRPPFRPMSPEQQNLQNYVLMVEPRRRLILIAVMVIAFLASGASSQGDWQAWQLFLHGQRFGVTDPLFHLDVGFYAWEYPVYRLLLGFGFTSVIFSILLVLGIHYLTGAIRLQTPGPKVTVSARRQLTILVFVFMLLKAAAYWLDRYGLVFSERSGKFTGASYTDVHSALPAKTILFWVTLILAIGVLASLWLRSTLLPGIGFVVLLVMSILIGGIYPAIVQQVSVRPNASTKETPYIRDNIRATRQAYNIETKTKTNDGTVSSPTYQVTESPNAKTSLTATDATIANARILDPNVLSPTFLQQQGIRNQYAFPAKLDVDRYTVGGTTGDYVVGVRELSQGRLTGDQSNWINQHTNFTHGYGFVAARANQNTSITGSYADGGIPPSGPLNDAAPLKTPQVYYGELLPDYAIVGAKGTPREYDGNGRRKITYNGKGGISLSNIASRTAFALYEGETNFLLNDAASASGARVIINRDPRQRVMKVAPFLKVDGDPYPYVDARSGHIMWIVDGYTTIANYPYSERRSLSDLTDDSLTRESRTRSQADTQVNYIRNSVKATVDGYDGTVTLYDWDKKDPVLKTWMKVFPGLVKTSIPQSVREHVRYPEDLFEVQRSLLEQYHVSDPTTFYNSSDLWTVPTDPASSTGGDQPPYYVLADPPPDPKTGEPTSTTPEFQLTSPMQVNQKTNLAAYITVDSDAPGDSSSTGSYGQMTVLKVPTDRNINGPEQISNDFNGTQAISQYKTLQSQAGSKVIEGNLLTLPIGRSFLFVQPWYVQGEKGTTFPLLRRVLVSYGGKVGFGDSLQVALDDLRQQRVAGSAINDSESGTSPTPTPTPSSPSSSSPPSGSSSPPSSGTTVPGSQAQIVQQLQRAYGDLRQAQIDGDQTRIADAQARINTLVGQLASPSRSSSRSPSGATSSSGTPPSGSSSRSP